MIVAKIAATKPVAGNTLTQDDSPADAQAFAQLLDEKTAESAAKSPLPAQGAARAGSPNPADSASSEVTDETGSPTAEDIANLSLLVFLNPFHASLPTGEAAKKEKLLPQEDALPGSDLLAGNLQPLTLLTHPDAAPLSAKAEPLTMEATASDENSLAVADVSLLPVTAETTTEHEHEHEHEAIASALRSAPATGLKPAVSQQDPQTGTAAITQLSAVTAAVGQGSSALPSGINMMPVKGAELSHPADRVNSLPDPALSPAVVSQPASATVTEPPATSGLLTQQMGTPAWQQSLGQQIACFTRDGIQHAELRLHPEELGSIQITLQLKNEQAQMHFVSPSHQVRAAIEAAVPHLRTSLAESGIELGQSSVGADSSSGWKDSGQSEQSGRQSFAQAQQVRSNQNPEERIETAVRTVSYNNGINTFA
ncbi:flagellar hook-length control protein FliK [Erwinia sp. P7711]|uniref:flagellar hook-length control protein FliK n=1 Tax=Erwinia sp. P7711 TaxID=3141451 RepID=UPI0031961814